MLCLYIHWKLNQDAPYYISDYEGRVVYALGKVCQGKEFYQCYQTLTDGMYLLRLGGGLFGRELNFPRKNATWNGCDSSGGDRNQLIFRISESRCVPLNNYRYNWRCDKPPIKDVSNAIATSFNVQSKAPTAGGTVRIYPFSFIYLFDIILCIFYLFIC